MRWTALAALLLAGCSTYRSVTVEVHLVCLAPVMAEGEVKIHTER